MDQPESDKKVVDDVDLNITTSSTSTMESTIASSNELFQFVGLLRRHAGELEISRVTDLHCPVDNKQYKRMDIEHIDGTFTSLDIISVNPSAQPFVHTGNTKAISSELHKDS